ncbi:Lrp/AsnC family transcriptional regulator [Yinghuangia aomiensis]
MKRRVDRLLETGVVTGFSASVEPSALGLAHRAFVELTAWPTSPEDIARARSPASTPRSSPPARSTGDADAVIHLLAADVQQFEKSSNASAPNPLVVRTKRRRRAVPARPAQRSGAEAGPRGPGWPPLRRRVRWSARACSRPCRPSACTTSMTRVNTPRTAVQLGGEATAIAMRPDPRRWRASRSACLPVSSPSSTCVHRQRRAAVDPHRARRSPMAIQWVLSG